MTRFVVDSGVVIEWSVPEVHSGDVLRYLDPALGRDAPELLPAEADNILWKEVGRGEPTPAEAEQIADDVRQADIVIYPMGPLIGPAPGIAPATVGSAYDCLYLALADAPGAPLVTADRRLFDSLRGGPYARLVPRVEDGP